MSVSYRPLSRTRWLVRVYRSSDGRSAYTTVRSAREAEKTATLYRGQELQGLDVVAAIQRTRKQQRTAPAPVGDAPDGRDLLST